MFEVYWLSDEGYEMVLGDYPTLEEANEAAKAMGDPNPHIFIFVRKMSQSLYWHKS